MVLLFAILGIKALIHPGLFTAHDIGHQVIRFYWYIQTVDSGHFPPYWVPNLASGLGYPLFMFSYHLPWLLGYPLYKASLDIPTIIKTLFILSYIFSGIFMYMLTVNLFKSRLAATLAAILYLWSPFHFLTILVSASMGNAFVFMFLPLTLLGIYLIFHNKSDMKGVVVLAISISGSILSHLTTFLFTLPLILMFGLSLLIRQNNKSFYLKRLPLGIVIGILITSFYLIPATYYSQFTQIKSNREFSTIYQKNFPNLTQFIYSKWGYAPIGESAKDGAISFQIGIAQWLSILIAAILLAIKNIPKQYQVLSLFLLISYLLSLISMLDISRPFWDILTKFITIDYPTRFMLTVTFIGSFISSLLIISLKKFRYLIFALLLVVTLYTNRNHIRVNQYTDFPLSFYLVNEITTSTHDEYLPKAANRDLLYHPALLETDEPVISQFAFSGQTLYVNNQKRDYSVHSDGRIKLNDLSKTDSTSVKFEDTLLIKVSKLLSVVGLLLLIYLLLPKHFTFNKSPFMKPKK